MNFEPATRSTTPYPLPLPKATILNGPKGSGKDTLARLLTAQDPTLAWISFAEPLRNAYNATFYGDLFAKDLTTQEAKDELVPNNTPPLYNVRQWLIDYGEWLRKTCGEDILGRIAVQQASTLSHHYHRFIFEAARTGPEARAVIDHFGHDNCLMVHLHREGHTWEGDLGEYIPTLPYMRIDNDGVPEAMLTKLELGLIDMQHGG